MPFAIKYRVRIPTLWPLIWLSLINYLIQNRLLSLHTQLVHSKIRASSIPKNSFLPTPMCQYPSSPRIHPESHHSEVIMRQQASGTYFVVKGSSTHSVQEHPGEPIGSLFSSIHTAHCALFPKENSQAKTWEQAGVTSSAQLPVTHLAFCPLFETSIIKINVTLWQKKSPFFFLGGLS